MIIVPKEKDLEVIEHFPLKLIDFERFPFAALDLSHATFFSNLQHVQ